MVRRITDLCPKVLLGANYKNDRRLNFIFV
jgi:hypothetical protein